jgi:hypothetical protein
VIEGDGRPVCLIRRRPTITLIDRLRSRFAMARVCVVADRRLIRVETLAELEALRLLYILGMRERQTTCFCGLFRLAMTASNAARSAVFSLIWVLSYIPQTRIIQSAGESSKESKCETWSTNGRTGASVIVRAVRAQQGGKQI